MVFANQHELLVFVFGILGNILSFGVFLAPVTTFTKIWKKKSTDGYKSLPYLVALFSSMLWINYALHKSNDILLMTINAFGCIVESVYIVLFIHFAPKQPKATTLKRLIVFNFGGFGAIVVLCHFFAKGAMQVKVLGWLCVVLSISSFAAPLSVMRLVIRTKSVEFIPFYLSLFLTLSAIMWFGYGLLLKDIFITLPNILGLVFGVIQMIIYGIYRKGAYVVQETKKIPEHTIDIVEINTKEDNEKPKPIIIAEEKTTSIKVEAADEEQHASTRQQSSSTDHDDASTITTGSEDEQCNNALDQQASPTLTSNERCMVATPVDERRSQFVSCAAA